ncbi:MAG: RcpC/CpaB family pilus assembly protein [Acidimicrobiales bacterium]
MAGATAYIEAHSTEQKAFKAEKLTSVYVVNGTVPVDESAQAAYSDGLITSVEMPTRYVPVGAVTDLGTIGTQVAGSRLGTGEVVVHDMFVDATTNPSRPSEAVPQGDVAVTVSVDSSAGVAGFIQPGDKVDILVDLDSNEEAYLYQGVSVLAVNHTLVAVPDTTSGTTPSTDVHEAATLVTFAMSAASAAHIPPTHSDGSAFTQGVYLALEGPSDQLASMTVVNGSTLIPGVHLSLGQGTTTGPVSNTQGPGASDATGTTGSGETGGTGSTSSGTTASNNTSGPNRAQHGDTP